MEEGDFEFVDEVYGGSIPKEFIGSVEKGFKSMMAKGRLIGFPVTGFRVVDQRWSGARGRLLGQRVSGSRARRIPVGLLVGEAADSRADHEGFGGRTARIPGRLRAHDHAAPRESSSERPRKKALSGSIRRCRWRKCSVIRPISGLRPRGRPNTQWSSHAMPRFRPRFTRNWSRSTAPA